MKEIVFEFIKSLAETFTSIMAAALGLLCEMFLDNDLTPTMDKFKDMFYSNGFSLDGGASVYEGLLELIETVSFSIVIAMVILRIFLTFMQKYLDFKESLPNTLIRCGITALVLSGTFQYSDALISIGSSFSSYIEEQTLTMLGIASDNGTAGWQNIVHFDKSSASETETSSKEMYKKLYALAKSYCLSNGIDSPVNEVDSMTNILETNLYKEAMAGTYGEKTMAQASLCNASKEETVEKNMGILGVLSSSQIQSIEVGVSDYIEASGIGLPFEMIFGLLAWIIQGVLIFVISYNLLKLCIELIKRYAMFAIMYIFGPIGGAFLCTAETTNITISYFKMFATQIGILIFTKFWIRFSLYLMGGLGSGIISAFMLIAILNIGHRIEGHLKDLGFSVTSQGGALLDNVVATGFIMGRAVAGAVSIGGKGLITAGVASGNIGLVKGGLTLTGKPINDSSVISAFTNGRVGHARLQGTGISGAEKKYIQGLAQRNGLFRNADLQKMLGTNAMRRNQAHNYLMNSEFANMKNKLAYKGIKMTPLGEYNMNNGFKVRLAAIDANGNTKFVRDAYLSDTIKGNPLEFAKSENGTNIYMNPLDDAPKSFEMIPLGIEGEKYSSDTPTGMESMLGIEMPESMLQRDANGVLDKDMSHYFASKDENGELQFHYSPDGTSGLETQSSMAIDAIKTEMDNNVTDNTVVPSDVTTSDKDNNADKTITTSDDNVAKSEDKNTSSDDKVDTDTTVSDNNVTSNDSNTVSNKDDETNNVSNDSSDKNEDDEKVAQQEAEDKAQQETEDKAVDERERQEPILIGGKSNGRNYSSWDYTDLLEKSGDDYILKEDTACEYIKSQFGKQGIGECVEVNVKTYKENLSDHNMSIIYECKVKNDFGDVETRFYKQSSATEDVKQIRNSYTLDNGSMFRRVVPKSNKERR